MNQNFRFNNPKQCSNWIILVSFCSSHLAIKNCSIFILLQFKKLMQKSIFSQKIQKSLCMTTKSYKQIQNFKFNYLKNYNDSEHAVKTKNAPFFMIFLNINKNGNFSPHWTGPLNRDSIVIAMISIFVIGYIRFHVTSSTATLS